MAQSFYRAIVNIEDVGFTIDLHGATAVAGVDVSYVKNKHGVTHVATAATFLQEYDAVAAEERLQGYIELCICADALSCVSV